MSELYLSWDVGISNLAYCIIEKIDEKLGKFKIKKWGIINLRDEIKCQEKDKNNNKCEKKAIYYSIKGNYCKVHSKKYIPEKIKQNECQDTDKCVHIINNTKTKTMHLCDKRAVLSLELDGKNYPYCKTHLDSHVKQITKDRSLKKINKTNANKIPLQTLAVKLFEHLEKNSEFLNVHEVLIENQPTFKNPTMKTISSFLYSYFMLKGFIENKTIKNVKFISPSNKLKVGSDADKKLKNVKKENNKKVYKMTKNLGIKFCKELIKDDEQNLEFIKKQKKQDDLCDSFLQAYYYIFCKNGVPKNVEDMLNKIVSEENDINSNNNKNVIDLSYLN